jgi:DNA-binding transcriptional MerR regulator
MSSEAQEQSVLPKEFTIDELAAETRVPSRTIRFYQSKSVLMAPVIRGRVAYYGDTHIERLKLIAQLQDRGLRIEGIRDLVTRIDKGELDVTEWLGLEASLKAPWVNEQPRTMSEAELLELAGTRRAGFIGDLLRTKAVTREGEVFLVRSPGMLKIAGIVDRAGVDLETASEANEIIRRHLQKASRELVEHFYKHFADITATSGMDWGSAVDGIRPIALEAVRIVFAQEMERALRELVDSGRTTKLPTKRGKK